MLPVMHYAWPVLISAAYTQVRKLRVIQLMRFRSVTTLSLYVCNKQIHESLEDYIFADHTKALTESFDSELAGARTS